MSAGHQVHIHKLVIKAEEGQEQFHAVGMAGEFVAVKFDHGVGLPCERLSVGGLKQQGEDAASSKY
ncbi:MAG: hypothetical protein Pyrs2KO_07130 [Pyruvatibacter sp.]